ncbi:hypothetical protein, partial [Rothia nasimurium]|uniref:hypothetical protein n=1 Tax=Rothia nasimurium TaxID=85336 RepID=UPI001F3D3D93
SSISISLTTGCCVSVMMDDKNVIYNIGTLLSFQATNRILNPSKTCLPVFRIGHSQLSLPRLGNSFSL